MEAIIWAVVALLAFTGAETSFSRALEALTTSVIDASELELRRFIDSGRFSNVYEAKIGGSQPCVCKVLKPDVLDTKILREVDILERCDDIEGVIHLLGIIKNDKSRSVGLIFESVGENYQWLSHKGRPPNVKSELKSELESSNPLSKQEIKYYMHRLLLTLQKIHRRGIMHRDVKPRNVIIDRVSRALKLIDFGHADILLAGKQYSNRVSSRSFKAPELLFDYRCYDGAIDVWACGCLFAGLIFKLEPFFYARPDPMNLGVISTVSRLAGSDTLLVWAKKWGIRMSDKQRRTVGRHPRVPLEHFRNEENKELACDQAIDLIKNMIEVDHSKRYTVDACLNHPYFDGMGVEDEGGEEQIEGE